MVKLLADTPYKASKIEIEITAHEWAEFLYEEYQRERDILRLHKKIGRTAVGAKGGGDEGDCNLSRINKEPRRKQS